MVGSDIEAVCRRASMLDIREFINRGERTSPNSRLLLTILGRHFRGYGEPRISMRKLLYVPIIHTEFDMGSVASAIEGKSASLCGEERWAKHKETVAKFWQSLTRYFDSLDATNLKIYQDGLPADGELGRKIIEEGARRGSKNHELILNMMQRGAEIRRTEDPSLLQEEYKYITRLARSKSFAEKALAYAGYKLRKGRLMDERDKFIAKTLNETLKEGETGVLLMGSHHNVAPYLAKDIAVEEVKEREKVNAYFKELASRGDERRFEQLAEYLCHM